MITTYHPEIWIFVYLAQLLIISLALGGLATFQPRLLMVPRLSRFLIGFCITPYMLALWMIFLAMILPRAPRWLFLILPLIIAVVLLIRYGPRALYCLIRYCHRTRKPWKNFWPTYLIYFSTILVLGLIITKLAVNSTSVITAHDSLNYLTKALLFAQERTISATVNYIDPADGLFRRDAHSFIFPAFLSHALLTTDQNQLGYPYDQAVRAAFQATFIYMLLAIIALAGISKRPGTSALALILLLQIPQLEYISYASSRDAFRIIPLILLAAALAGLSPRRIHHKLPLLSLLPIMILAAFSLMGHTLGGFVVVVLALSWFIWGLLQRVYRLRLLLVPFIIVVGLFLGGVHYWNLYLETGSVRAEGSGKDAFKGTLLENKIIPTLSEDRVAAIQSTKSERLSMVLQMGGSLMVPGLLGSGVLIFFWVWFKKRNTDHFLFMGLIGFTAILPFTGVLDIGAYSLSKAFASNMRYSLHWYPFIAVNLASLASFLYVTSQHDTFAKLLARRLSLIFLVLITTYSAYKTIDTEWRVQSKTAQDNFLKDVKVFQDIIANTPDDKRVFMSDDRYTYYLEHRVMIKFSRPTWEVTRAKNEDEVKNALAKLKIGAVVLNQAEIQGWWDQLPLFSYLNNAPNVVLVFSNKKFRVYRIVEDKTEGDDLVKTCLAQIGCNISADQLYQVAAKLQGDGVFPGYLHLIRGEWDQAITAYNSLANTHPSSISIHLILAKAYQATGRTKDMLANYQQIVMLSDPKEEIRHYLATELNIDPLFVFNYLAEGELYQTPLNPNTRYNFLDHLDDTDKVSPDNANYIYRSAFIIDQLPRGVIFAHAPAEVAFQLNIPAGANLTFAPALAPAVWQAGKGDGVQFDIYLESSENREKIFSRYIDPKNLSNDRRWHDTTLDLSPWIGQSVKIIFTTNPGPNKDDRFDWAGWGEPRLIQEDAYDFSAQATDPP